MATSPDPRAPATGYPQQPDPYQQQPPPQQPYYGYPPPQGYGPPPGYAYPPYGPYGYYPAVYAPQPDRSKSTIAGVFWILCLLRDIFFLLFYLTIGAVFGALGFGFPGATGGLFVLFALFPILGAAGCVVAMIADFQHKNHSMGTAGAVMALVGSSFPGVIVVGPAGLILSLIALILHVSAKTDFAGT